MKVDDHIALRVRVPRELLRRVDHVAADMGVGRPRAIVALLERGMPEEWRKPAEK